MGERIRQARMEAGMSQRQLAGEIMTRNMLSALEHDSANPSVGTLQYLSEKLRKPISYFFGEEVCFSDDHKRIDQARDCLTAEAWQECLDLLDAVTDPSIPEICLLRSMAYMGQARTAIANKRIPYAKDLLERSMGCMEGTVYAPLLRREWIILMARVDGGECLDELDREDEVLLLRAGRYFDKGRIKEAEALLEAVEARGDEWYFLRGEIHFYTKSYELAAKCYHLAEAYEPRLTAKRLEICYRETGDYRNAYYYAVKGNESSLN